MAGISYPYREDWSGSGFFGWDSTGVQYGHNGIKGLRHFAPFDEEEWRKLDVTGACIHGHEHDLLTSRLSERLTAVTVVAGVGFYRMYRRLRLPRDFGQWAFFTVFTKKEGPTAKITEATWGLQKNGVDDSSFHNISFLPDAASEWQQFTAATSDAYSPGDFLTFVVEFKVNGVTDPGGPILYVADLAATYVCDKVNG